MSTVEGIEFCDPPMPLRKKLRPVADALKARPGEWAKINTLATRGSAYSVAADIRRGSGTWAPAGSFEATARGCLVWARYVGDGS